ncbi:hypothetical protein MTO96_010039 [Rhipicephalus appendiculatus]
MTTVRLLTIWITVRAGSVCPVYENMSGHCRLLQTSRGATSSNRESVETRALTLTLAPHTAACFPTHVKRPSGPLFCSTRVPFCFIFASDSGFLSHPRSADPSSLRLPVAPQPVYGHSTLSSPAAVYAAVRCVRGRAVRPSVFPALTALISSPPVIADWEPRGLQAALQGRTAKPRREGSLWVG